MEDSLVHGTSCGNLQGMRLVGETSIEAMESSWSGSK